MTRKVYVVGVGMTKFEKPGPRRTGTTRTWSKRRASKALADAGIRLRRDPASGRRLLLRRIHLGRARALRARADRHPDLQREQQLLDRFDGAVPGQAVGRGRRRRLRARRWASRRWRRARSAPSTWTAANPIDKHMLLMMELRAVRRRAARAAAVRQRRTRAHGSLRHHGRAIRQDRLEEPQALGEQSVLAVPGRVLARRRDERRKMVYEPLTKLQCCPTSDGAGVAILASEDFVREHGLEDQAVEIAGMAMATDFRSTFDDKSCIKLVGYDMTQERRTAGLRADRPRPGKRRRDRAPRLLLQPTS